MSLSYGSQRLYAPDGEMDSVPRNLHGTDSASHGDEDLIVETTNRKLVNRQKAVVQEQRLHTLFQILGLTLHELNQPLTSLLGNLELFSFYRDKPEKLDEFHHRLSDAGKRLSDVVKKLQDIREDMRIPRFDLTKRQAVNRPFTILAMVRSDDVYQTLCEILAEQPKIALHRVIQADDKKVWPLIDVGDIELIIVEDHFLGNKGTRLVRDIKSRHDALPLVVIGDAAAVAGFRLTVYDMVEEFLSKDQLGQTTLIRVIDSAMETALMKKGHASSLEKIAEISKRDPATGLFQRRFFTDALERRILRAGRDETSFYICKAAIDNMQDIVDKHGHDVCKKVLTETASVLGEFSGEHSALCRFGRNAFAFLQPVRTESDSDVARKMLETFIEQHFQQPRAELPVARISIKTIFYSSQRPCALGDLIRQLA